ncbi:MAG: hypothetical protein U0269_00335 [Polyangiales bacterium]
MGPDEIQRMAVSDLDALYIQSPLRPLPRGMFKGRVLRWLPPARLLRNAGFVFLEVVGFELLPWGIDFDSTKWWVGAKFLQGGYFSPIEGASRWRPTECVQLRYDKDPLPFARRYLYDEVKPLSDELCLGIGGINADKGIGDHFYYLLQRAR